MHHSEFLRSRYFGSLDGLRGASIIPVVWHHIGGHGREGILGRGHYGVQLFFAISGLLITTLLLREQDRDGTVSLRNFYIRRTLRIFPLYYAVLAVYVAVVAIGDGDTAAGRQFFANLPAFATYTSNWLVDLTSGNRVIFYFAWSLATEEQFYLFWPSVVRFARARWSPPLFMVAMLVVGEVTVRAAGAGLWSRDLLVVRILGSVASPICLGCLAAYALHRPGSFGVVARIAGRRWSAPLAAALLVLALSLDEVPTLVVALAMTFLVTACAIRPDHGLRRVLDHPVLRHVGSVSYGMYLTHMLAINTVRRAILPGAAALAASLGAPALATTLEESELATFLVALPLTVGIATVSYRLFEQRFIRLKERFTGRAAPATAPRVAAE